MAIKYYVKPSTKQIFAELRGCEMDALNKIDKYMNGLAGCWGDQKYFMKDTYRVSVRCSADDVFDEEVGKKIAKAKLMKTYYRDFDNIMNRFRYELLELHDRVFENNT